MVRLQVQRENSMYEKAKKISSGSEESKAACCTFGCVGIIYMLHLALGIAAIVTSHENAGCMHKFPGISFGYDTWLLVFGALAIFQVCFAVLVMFLAAICGVPELGECILKVEGGFMGLFQIAWYVVGAILLFDEVAPFCNHQMGIYQLGLGIFILESIVYGCLLCSSILSERLK